MYARSKAVRAVSTVPVLMILAVYAYVFVAVDFALVRTELRGKGMGHSDTKMPKSAGRSATSHAQARKWGRVTGR